LFVKHLSALLPPRKRPSGIPVEVQGRPKGAGVGTAGSTAVLQATSVQMPAHPKSKGEIQERKKILTFRDLPQTLT